VSPGDQPGNAGADRVAEAGPEPLVYYRADPRRFGTSAQWLPVFLRMAGAAGVVPQGQQEVFNALMFVGLMGTYPHRFAVLDLQAHRFTPRDVKLTRFRSVLVFDAPGQYAQIKQALVSVLMPGRGADAADDAKQTAINLPPAPGSDQARPGVRFTRDSWRPGHAVEWTADGRSFYIGFGRGSLRQWLTWQDAQREAHGEAAPHPRNTKAHRQAVSTAREHADDAGVFFELFLDLERLKRAAPTLFQTGRITPLLRLYGVDDATRWMMHGRWSGKFLLFDLTWEKPDGRPGALTHRELTQDHWPDDVGLPRPPGHFLVVAPIDWPAAVNQLLQVVWLAHEPEDRHLVTANLDAFFERTRVTFSRTLRRFEPYLLMSGHPRSMIPLPGTATLYAPVKEGADAQAAQREFDTMMATLLPGNGSPLAIAQPRDADALRVRRDPATKVYWLGSPLDAIFKAPAWVWHEPTQPGNRPLLIGSYSPQAVLTNARWLDGPE